MELGYDNTPCHTAVSINEFLAEKKCIPVVPQPPYSPDLSPCDFFLFSRLKNHLIGRHFGTLDNIQKSVTDELKGILAEAFQHCYENGNNASVVV
jgi:transposase